MAELNTAESGSKKKHGGKARSKKMSTKVDLTPMVDLAFLLITFFMLTTTLNKPNAMEVNIPKKPDKPEELLKVDERTILHLLLDKDDEVWWYEGIEPKGLKKTGFYNERGIRDVIYKKQAQLKKDMGSSDTLVVLIKTTDKARFKDMIDALDEMDITGVKKYALQDAEPIEVEAIANGGTATAVKE